MGYRLHGPTLRLTKAQEMISEAVTFGTIQVPADGHPIILLADRQQQVDIQKSDKLHLLIYHLLHKQSLGMTFILCKFPMRKHKDSI